MKIGFIGAGKAGCSIGNYLAVPGSKDYVLTGYYSRSYESAKWAAEYTNTGAYKNLKDLVKASDTLIISAPDGEIKPVWDCIVEILREAECVERPGESPSISYVCHFSGSLSSDVFVNREKYGIKACSLHPIYPFSTKTIPLEKLKAVIFTIEGDSEACKVLGSIFTKKGNTVRQIDSACKAKYHAAASVLSNLVLALLDMGQGLWEDCGFGHEEAFRAAAPLVENNIKDYLENGAVNALTGPIERADAETVKKHLSVLCGDDGEIYRLLGKRLIRLAEEKHPERNYEELERILAAQES